MISKDLKNTVIKTDFGELDIDKLLSLCGEYILKDFEK